MLLGFIRQWDSKSDSCLKDNGTVKTVIYLVVAFSDREMIFFKNGKPLDESIALVPYFNDLYKAYTKMREEGFSDNEILS